MDLLLSDVNKRGEFAGTSAGTGRGGEILHRCAGIRHDRRVRFQVGDRVHLPGFGTGIVREVRNAGRYLVEIKGRPMVALESQLAPAGEIRPRRAARPGLTAAADSSSGDVPSIDLHGLTVDEALDALDAFLNDALLSGASEARVIHGRSGGRLKSAVHARLKKLTVVRAFRVDAANSGVTIVAL